MTYLVYGLWLLSIFWIAGEIDRHLHERYGMLLDRELPSGSSWLLSGFASLLLPGAGQFLNRQPVKAAFVLAWPFLMLLIKFPRPWQMLQFSSYALLLPWWLLAVGDALAVGLIIHYRQRWLLAREAKSLRESDHVRNMDSFLERRKMKQNHQMP